MILESVLSLYAGKIKNEMIKNTSIAGLWQLFTIVFENFALLNPN